MLYAQRYGKRKCRTEQNAGRIHAQNAGMGRCRCKYIFTSGRKEASVRPATVLAGCELPSIQQESRRPCQPWQPIHLTRARNQSISAALTRGGIYCIGNPGESATDLEPRAIRPTYRAFALVFATSVSIRKDRESTPSQRRH